MVTQETEVIKCRQNYTLLAERKIYLGIHGLAVNGNEWTRHLCGHEHLIIILIQL